jgi:membrane protease YdiL (CAAX protease family)
MLLSAAIFSLGHDFHFLGPKFIQCMLLGTSLAWISVRRGLWTAVVVHWLFNILVNVTLL